MSAVERTLVVDTSVLLNFIVVDRVDLLAAVPTTRCVVTDHVRGEIAADRPEQVEAYETAIERGFIVPIRIDRPAEVEAFVRLSAAGLGLGESSAVAAAIHRGFAVAIDDRRAIRIAVRTFGELIFVGSADIVREAIDRGALTVPAADAIKERWEKFYRFTLPFDSFGDQRA